MNENSEDLATQPTATALMERVRDVEVRLARKIDSLAARTDAQTTRLESQIIRLEGQISSMREEIANTVQSQMTAFRDEIVNSVQGQISSLREEVMKGFYKLNNGVTSLAEDTLDMRANQRDVPLSDPEITERIP